MENLLKHFRERNEQYEHLLNESIMVNNRIHKKKIAKITKIKESERLKFKKRLNYFLKNSGIEPENIKGMKFKVKSKNDSELKSQEKSEKKLKKKKSKSFFDIIKKSIMLGNSSNRSLSPESTSINNKKENNISKEPKMFVNYESESQSSSENELDSKIKEMQDPRARRKILEERRMMEEISESDERESKAESSDTKVKLMNLSKNFPSKTKLSHFENSLGPKFQFESQVIVQKKIEKLNSKRETSKLKKEHFLTNKNEDNLKMSYLNEKISFSKTQNCKL